MKATRLAVACILWFALALGSFAGEDHKTALEKVNDHLYDATKDGLKTLKFEVRFDPPLEWGKDTKISSATVYWKSPTRLNVVDTKAPTGRAILVHPMFTWTMDTIYIGRWFPLGMGPAIFSPDEKFTVKTAKAGHSISAEKPIRRDGKVLGNLRTVCECNKRYAVTEVKTYGIIGSNAPPGQPDATTKYRILDNGKSVPVRLSAYYGRWRTIEYTKIGKFWLPCKLIATEANGTKTKTTTFTFDRYKINPRLPRSAFSPPKWPQAKIELSSPRKTLRSLYDALYLGDMDGIGGCLSKESRKRWDSHLANMRQQFSGPKANGMRVDWRTWWGGFIHGNAGKTSKLLLSREKQTDNTFTAHLKTVTTGRPVDLQIKLVKEGRSWKVANTPDELMKGYD